MLRVPGLQKLSADGGGTLVIESGIQEAPRGYYQIASEQANMAINKAKLLPHWRNLSATAPTPSPLNSCRSRPMPAVSLPN